MFLPFPHLPVIVCCITEILEKLLQDADYNEGWFLVCALFLKN